MTQEARLIGGPAHGRIYAMPDGEHTCVVAEMDEDPARFLAEYDPLEYLFDPLAWLEPTTYSQHLYIKRHFIDPAQHPCVPGVALVRHRYLWLHQATDPEDPLIYSWVLAEPVDRAEWLVWEFDHWTPSSEAVRPDMAEWLAWTSPDRPRCLILTPTPSTRRDRRVLLKPTPDYRLIERKAQARTAADRALVFYPGPVGELLSRELNVWADFAFRFAEDAPLIAPLIDQLIDFLLDPKRTIDRRGIGRSRGWPGG